MEGTNQGGDCAEWSCWCYWRVGRESEVKKGVPGRCIVGVARKFLNLSEQVKTNSLNTTELGVLSSRAGLCESKRWKKQSTRGMKGSVATKERDRRREESLKYE